MTLSCVLLCMQEELGWDSGTQVKIKYSKVALRSQYWGSRRRRSLGLAGRQTRKLQAQCEKCLQKGKWRSN